MCELIHSEKLEGVHPQLVEIVKNAVLKLPFSVLVVEGVRSLERQRELYAQGRNKPGKIVTWTMSSKHIRQVDGFGHAVDLVPYIDGKIDWTPGKNFDTIADALFEVAKASKTRIRWGADWDQDGKRRERGETDSPHFELA